MEWVLGPGESTICGFPKSLFTNPIPIPQHEVLNPYPDPEPLPIGRARQIVDIHANDLSIVTIDLKPDHAFLRSLSVCSLNIRCYLQE